MKIRISIFLLILILASCNTSENRKEEIMDMVESAGDINPFDILSDKDKELISDEYDFEDSNPNGVNDKSFNKKQQDDQKSTTYNRKLIKTGSVKYETEDIKKSRLQIENIVKKYNSFISDERNNNYSYETNQNITIRIPYDSFDKFIENLSSEVSNFDYKNIHVKDVTEEYVDIKSRLIAKHKLEESYLALLKKALKIKDILEIEKQLNIVRSDIESMEGRLRYLKDQVSLSTLVIIIYERKAKTYRQKKGFFSKLWYNIQDGFSNLLYFVLNLVSIWPFIIILLVVLFFIKRLWKKRFK